MAGRVLRRARRETLLWLALLLLPLLGISAALLVQRERSDSAAAGPAAAWPVATYWTGRPAPELALPRLDGGGELRLAALRGRPALVNFWASWCAPCRRELPTLEAFARGQRGPAAMQVLAVNVGEDATLVREFLDVTGASALRVLLDRDSRAHDAWGVAGLPMSYFIDARGRITGVQAGELTRAELERRLAQATG